MITFPYEITSRRMVMLLPGNLSFGKDFSCLYGDYTERIGELAGTK